MAIRKDRLQERAAHFDPDEIEGIHFVTPEEGRALFDREAKRLFGISGEEFLRRWDAGEYREVFDVEDHYGVLMVATLIPWVRP